MKKILIILMLTLIIIMNIGPANAKTLDEFEFVANLRFGMTVEQAQNLLKKNHIEYTIYDLTSKPTEPTAQLTRSYNIEARWVFYIEEFRVAGYLADGFLFFNLNNTLSDIEYLFRFGEDNGLMNKTFDAIENLLQTQYGATDYTSESCKKINTKVSHEPKDYEGKGTQGSVYHEFHVLGYTERLISTGSEYDVMIQHHKYLEGIIMTTFKNDSSKRISDHYKTKVSYSLNNNTTSGIGF